MPCCRAQRGDPSARGQVRYEIRFHWRHWVVPFRAMNHLSCIRIFKRVVELGSFSKASEELSISQSSVTKSITQLEQHLGTRLLNRNTRGISLTEDGLTYYERCTSIIAEIDNADAAVGQRSKTLAGTLRISTSVAFGRRILAPMLMDFMRQQPRWKIDLTGQASY